MTLSNTTFNNNWAHIFLLLLYAWELKLRGIQNLFSSFMHSIHMRWIQPLERTLICRTPLKQLRDSATSLITWDTPEIVNMRCNSSSTRSWLLFWCGQARCCWRHYCLYTWHGVCYRLFGTLIIFIIDEMFHCDIGTLLHIVTVSLQRCPVMGHLVTTKIPLIFTLFLA